MKRVLISILLSFSFLMHAQERPLVFATYQYASNNRVKNIEPFAQHFEKLSGRKTTVTSYPTVEALITGIVNGEVDFAFINTFGYLLLTEAHHDFKIAAALHVSDSARSTYQSVIVTSKSSGIKTFDDLKKHASQVNCLLVNPGSTSGNLIPRLQLSKIGLTDIDQSFKAIIYTKNHALTLQYILDGKAEVGSFGSEEYYKAIQKDKTIVDKINLLWESDPIPLGPAIYNKKLDGSLTQVFTKALLELHETNADALQALKDGWTEALPADYFHVVDDTYYNSLIKENPDAGRKIIRQFAN